MTATQTGSEIVVGRHILPARALLAPMSGVSDAPFRALAVRYGAGLVTSEMIASDRLVARETEATLRLERGNAPIFSVQLAGCRPADLERAAQIAEAAGADIIDINMGCPAKKVVGGQAGSALMRDVDHATGLIKATVGAVSVPVTVKMRLGFDNATRNAPELARRAEAEGAAMLTVHGRTRCQRYKGVADWAAIAETVAATRLPIIANGDCHSVADARTMLTRSHAAGVMIGRAALGAPWLPGAIGAQLNGGTPPAVPSTPEEIGAVALVHFDMMVEHVGADRAVRLMRKHIQAYAQSAGLSGARVRRALTSENPDDARALIEDAFSAPVPEKAAA